MGQILFEAIENDEKRWTPVIRIREVDVSDVLFVMVGSFETQDQAGDFIKWFYGLISNKEKQKNFVYSKDGMTPEEMGRLLGRT